MSDHVGREGGLNAPTRHAIDWGDPEVSYNYRI